MEDIKDSKEEINLPVHTLETMKMGDETVRHILVRDGDEVKCPEATRLLMPVASESGIMTNPEQQHVQYGVAETPCGSWCGKFGIRPQLDQEKKKTGGIVVAMGCCQTVHYIANKKLPEQTEAKEVKMNAE